MTWASISASAKKVIPVVAVGSALFLGVIVLFQLYGSSSLKEEAAKAGETAKKLSDTERKLTEVEAAKKVALDQASAIARELEAAKKVADGTATDASSVETHNLLSKMLGDDSAEVEIDLRYRGKKPAKDSPAAVGGGAGTATAAPDPIVTVLAPPASASADLWDSLPEPLREKAKQLHFTRGNIKPSDTRTIRLAIDLDKSEAARKSLAKRLADIQAKLTLAEAAKKVAAAEVQAKAQLQLAGEAKVSLLQGEIQELQKQGTAASDRIDELQKQLEVATQDLVQTKDDAQAQANAKAQADAEVTRLLKEVNALKAAASKVVAPPPITPPAASPPPASAPTPTK